MMGLVVLGTVGGRVSAQALTETPIATMVGTSVTGDTSDANVKIKLLQAQMELLNEQIKMLKQQRAAEMSGGSGKGSGYMMPDGDSFTRPIMATGTTPLGLEIKSIATNFKCHALARSLMLGSRGDDVKAMQEMLRVYGKGVWPDGQEPTGYYGKLTEQAVRRMQEHENIVSTGDARTTGYGVMGRMTRERIKKVICKDMLVPMMGGANVATTTPAQ